MTKMAATPKYGKNRRADDFEIWYVILVAPFIQMISLGWPWHFYAKVKVGHLGFCMIKGEPVDFLNIF